MSLFAEQAASAIANARLYATEHERVTELIELDRMKRDFVATVSHELRTPLTSIVAAARTAQRPGTETQQAEFWQIVERQADRPSTTVEEILDAAKLVERDGQPRALPGLRRRRGDARLAVADFAMAGRVVEIEAPGSAVAFVDPHAMRRVIDNLIENAYKYGVHRPSG